MTNVKAAVKKDVSKNTLPDDMIVFLFGIRMVVKKRVSVDDRSKIIVGYEGLTFKVV